MKNQQKKKKKKNKRENEPTPHEVTRKTKVGNKKNKKQRKRTLTWKADHPLPPTPKPAWTKNQKLNLDLLGQTKNKNITKADNINNRESITSSTEHDDTFLVYVSTTNLK